MRTIYGGRTRPGTPRAAGAPGEVRVVDSLLTAPGLRVPNLWPLRDSVVSFTLQSSVIRIRNALPKRSSRILSVPLAKNRKNSQRPRLLYHCRPESPARTARRSSLVSGTTPSSEPAPSGTVLKRSRAASHCNTLRPHTGWRNTASPGRSATPCRSPRSPMAGGPGRTCPSRAFRRR